MPCESVNFSKEFAANVPDKAQWIVETRVCFSVKNEDLEIIRTRGHPPALLSMREWTKFWKLKTQDCLEHFLGKVLWNALPMRANIARFLDNISYAFGFCQFCDQKQRPQSMSLLYSSSKISFETIVMGTRFDSL